MIVSNNLGGYRAKSPEREAADSMQDMSEEFVSKMGAGNAKKETG